jgi:hypothetical protein
LIWQIGSLVGSGVLGLVAVKMLQMTGGSSVGLIVYVAVLGIVSTLCIYWLPETAPLRRGGDLHDWGTPQRAVSSLESHSSPVFAARR